MPPDDLLRCIERLVGAPITSATPVAGGYSPATRLLCRTATASCFAKIGSSPLTSAFLRREIQVYTQLSGPFMPRMLAWEDHADAPILIIEDLSGHQWPPPWDGRRVELVLEQLDALHHTQVALETYAEVHASTGVGWRTVAADPAPFLSLGIADSSWLAEALPLLLESEGRCSTAGDSLTHWDIRSDNICFATDRALFVDWNHACLSNPRLDLGFWLPSLAYEGGPAPEEILPDAPEVAAWVSGFFAAHAGLPDIVDAPQVPLVQRQQLATALPWAVRALDLPPVHPEVL